MPDHECHFLCCNVLCGNDKVPLIFAIGRVQDYDEFTVPKRPDGFFNAIEVELRLSIGLHLQAIVLQAARGSALVYQYWMRLKDVSRLQAFLHI